MQVHKLLNRMKYKWYESFLFRFHINIHGIVKWNLLLILMNKIQCMTHLWSSLYVINIIERQSTQSLNHSDRKWNSHALPCIKYQINFVWSVANLCHWKYATLMPVRWYHLVTSLLILLRISAKPENYLIHMWVELTQYSRRKRIFYLYKQYFYCTIFNKTMNPKSNHAYNTYICKHSSDSHTS